MTVHDVALNKQELPILRPNGVAGYKVPDPDLRFNFPGERKFLMPKSKNKNFLDSLIHSKRIIPGPGNYVKQANWAKGRNLSIYTMNRKSFIDDIMRKSKLTPGIGKYDSTRFDRKFGKEHNCKISDTEQATYLEEVMEKASAGPRS